MQIYLFHVPSTVKINFLAASRDCCRLLITFANSLDPDQDQQNVGSDLYPQSGSKLFDTDSVPERTF